jgi:hypothetical protein
MAQAEIHLSAHTNAQPNQQCIRQPSLNPRHPVAVKERNANGSRQAAM